MLNLQAVDCWRYHPESVSVQEVVSPPSCKQKTSGFEFWYSRHIRNCIRIISGREMDGESGAVCSTRTSRMKSHLSSWREDGTLFHDKHAVYLIEQEFSVNGKNHIRRGLALRTVLQSPDEEGIVFLEPEGSNEEVSWELERMTALQGQVEPLPTLISADAEGLAGLLETLVHWEPTVEVVLPEGVTTRVWIVDKGDRIGEVLGSAATGDMLILENRARYEAALQYRDITRTAMEEAGIALPEYGGLPTDSILTVCFPVPGEGVILPGDHPALELKESFDLESMLERTAEDGEKKAFPDIPSGLFFYLFN